MHKRIEEGCLTGTAGLLLAASRASSPRRTRRTHQTSARARRRRRGCHGAPARNTRPTPAPFYSGPRQGTDPVPTPPSTPTPPSPPPPQLPMPPPPPSASSCASDSSWRDSDGDRCSHYDDKPEWCGFEDSQARCCACKTSASQPCATPVKDSSCARGVRVARGPHWRWGDQDGGVGGVGTVTGRADESGWCTVTWDQGGSNAYRVGSFSMFDLCRWTPGPSGTPPPTVGRTTTAHTRDDDQEGRQHDTRTTHTRPPHQLWQSRQRWRRRRGTCQGPGRGLPRHT